MSYSDLQAISHRDMELENERCKLDMQESEIYFYCARCGSEIYEGNNYYLHEREVLCEDCFDELLSDYKKNCERIAEEDY